MHGRQYGPSSFPNQSYNAVWAVDTADQGWIRAHIRLYYSKDAPAPSDSYDYTTWTGWWQTFQVSGKLMYFTLVNSPYYSPTNANFHFSSAGAQ